MDLEELKKSIEEVPERNLFSDKEEKAMILMYNIDYPVQFQEADMTIEEIVALKEKNMRLLEEAQSLLPLVDNILSLPAIVVAVLEEDEYV